MSDQELTERDDNEMDTWMEMNRSLSLFFAITRLVNLDRFGRAFSFIFQLISLAMVILLASNRDSIYNMLLTSEEIGKKMEDIPLVLSLVLIGTVGQFAFTSILGIWGYARLNRHLLVYYGCTLLLSMLWAVYWFLIIYYEEREDFHRIATVMDYKYNKKARKVINILQKYYKCCGFSFYQFEDVVPLPRSCCSSVPKNRVCVKRNAYKRRCETKRMDVFESLKISGTWTYIPYMGIIYAMSTSFEVFLAYNMVYHVFKQRLED